MPLHSTFENILSTLPLEVIENILSRLSVQDLDNLSCVSWDFRTLLLGQAEYTHSIWRSAFCHRFGDRSRYFGRISNSPSWKAELFLRCNLIDILQRARPTRLQRWAAVDLLTLLTPSPSSSRSTCKSPVLRVGEMLYNSHVGRRITHLIADFGEVNGSMHIMHGSHLNAQVTRAVSSLPSIDVWGSLDTIHIPGFSPILLNANLSEEARIECAGFANRLSISLKYGMAYCTSWPNGGVWYRSLDEARASKLALLPGADAWDIRIPDPAHEGYTALWLAPSEKVVERLKGTMALVVGSSKGIITVWGDLSMILANSTSGDLAGCNRFTGLSRVPIARWILCPGVPIVSITVDEEYNTERHALRRICIVVVNALGELYYLCDVPSVTFTEVEQLVEGYEKFQIGWSHGGKDWELAWKIGERTRWHNVGCSQRRLKRANEWGGGDTGKRTLALHHKWLKGGADANEIAMKLYQVSNTEWKECYERWDMQRKIQVDFASTRDDGWWGCGECVVLINRTIGDPDSILRYKRKGEDDWELSYFLTGENTKGKVTAYAMDQSKLVKLLPYEDIELRERCAMYPEEYEWCIPGRRARLLGIGTIDGMIILWNIRVKKMNNKFGNGVTYFEALWNIQTASPRITCLGITSLAVIHGGSDGAVEVWHLPEICNDVGEHGQRIATRTIISRLGRRLRLEDHHADGEEIGNEGVLSKRRKATAIYLDEDSHILRGIVALGELVLYWCYGRAQTVPFKLRGKNILRSLGGDGLRRRNGGESFNLSKRAKARRNLEQEIREEEERMREEDEEREEKRQYEELLASRFGVGLLQSEDEALNYAKLLSTESLIDDEQRRRRFAEAFGDEEFDRNETTRAEFSQVEESHGWEEETVANRGEEVENVTGQADGENFNDEDIWLAMQLSLVDLEEKAEEEGIRDGELVRVTEDGGNEEASSYKFVNGEVLSILEVVAKGEQDTTSERELPLRDLRNFPALPRSEGEVLERSDENGETRREVLNWKKVIERND